MFFAHNFSKKLMKSPNSLFSFLQSKDVVENRSFKTKRCNVVLQRFDAAGALSFAPAHIGAMLRSLHLCLRHFRPRTCSL